MANPSKNTQYYKITNTKATVPAAVTKTGTIETDGIAIIGTGTTFLTGTNQLRRGSWVVGLAQDEVRQIDRVESNELAFMTDAFTADLAPATALSVIQATDLNLREISIAIPLGLTDGEIDGTALEAGLPVSFGKNSDTKDNFKSFVDPVIVNATGTEANITILK